MSVTMAQVLEQLVAEGLLDDAGRDTAVDRLERQAVQQPWYIRAMVGFGAWLASLLLIGFVGSFALMAEAGYAFVGIVFIGAAIFARRRYDNDFMVQAALAVSLAGQALLSWGFVQTIGGDEPEAYCTFVIVMSSVLFFAMPDRIHRVIMVLLAAACTTALLYFLHLNDVVPVLGPMLAAALVVLHLEQGMLIEEGYGSLLRPLLVGLMLAAFGLLLISTIYVLPELTRGETEIYPRPWVSTLILGALLLWVAGRTLSTIDSVSGSRSAVVIYALLLLVVAGCHAAPGILLALIVVLLGAASGDRNFVGAGIGFLAIFLAAYFYGIEVTMLTKSITLVATGSVLLLARWLLLALIGPDSSVEARRA